MKNKIKIIVGIMLAFGMDSVDLLAEKHIVLPGASIQSKINIAKEGDSIFIAGGTYSEDITVKKNLDIRRMQNQNVIITGSFTVESLDQKFELRDFKIGADDTKGLVIKNCDNIFIANIDLTTGGEISVESSKVNATNCQTAMDVIANNSTLSLTKCNLGRFVTVTGKGKFVLFQSKVKDTITTKTNESWIGYNLIRAIIIENKGVIVGNTINGRRNQSAVNNWYTSGVHLKGENTAVRICNNFICNQGETWVVWRDNRSAGAGILVEDNAKCTITNNVIYRCYGATMAGGIFVESSKSTLIMGNIIFDSYGVNRENGNAIHAPFENVVVKNNHIWRGARTNPPYEGGVTATDTTYNIDPRFVDWRDGLLWDKMPDLHLNPDSPCIDAGPEEVWLRDRDGTRNDIGLYGGPFYDPEGATTTKPVVLAAEIEPIQLIKGVDTKISLKSRGIVVPE